MRILLTLIVLCALHAPLGAQSAAPLAGAAPAAPPVALSEAARRELGGRPRASVLGGVAGFVLGAVAGGVAGCHFNRDDYGVFCAGQSDTKVFGGAAIGGVAGGVLGAVLFRGTPAAPQRRPAPAESPAGR